MEEIATPRQQAVAGHVTHALTMIGAMPDYTEDAGVPGAAQVACLEAFFVNARLLIEFLGVRGPDDRDLRATEFLADWTPLPEYIEQMQATWLLTSQHVVHLSQSRVPEVVVDDVDVTRDGLRRYAAPIEREMHRLGDTMLQRGQLLGGMFLRQTRM